ncbi:hypothetical protein DPMN_107384 [Dreissena polymorpha]|uniref:Uncharacterized protein n=1 Tax=Dreissena polymorpha TaxID=45954 RepID=A0A9D4K6R6_DREPO|nr:hypothetical protein DPMN_107384 [Dreissena polymorpha]
MNCVDGVLFRVYPGPSVCLPYWSVIERSWDSPRGRCVDAVSFRVVCGMMVVGRPSTLRNPKTFTDRSDS